jgi:hypothetical protein
VAPLYLFTRGRAALDDVEGVEQDQQALARLDVRLRRVELGESGVAYELRRSTQLRQSLGQTVQAPALGER